MWLNASGVQSLVPKNTTRHPKFKLEIRQGRPNQTEAENPRASIKMPGAEKEARGKIK